MAKLQDKCSQSGSGVEDTDDDDDPIVIPPAVTSITRVLQMAEDLKVLTCDRGLDTMYQLSRWRLNW